MNRFMALVVASLISGGCYKEPMDPGEKTLTLTVTADSTPADSATLIRVRAAIPKDASADRRTVEFSSSRGTFVDGGLATVSITALDSIAETYIRAPRTPGQARIRAKLGSEIREFILDFTTAYPTRADLQPEKFTLEAGLANATTITAYLRRNIGLVTPGVEVHFVAVREDNQQEIGQFGVPSRSDPSGSVTVKYSAGETDEYPRNVLIRAYNAADGRLLGQTTITIVEPAVD